MKFWRRGFCYLGRKKGKSLMLLGIFFVISILLLVSFVILKTAEETGQRLREKTGSKLLLQTGDGKCGITEEMLSEILALPDVRDVNRSTAHEAYPSGFFPVTGSESEAVENRTVTLQAMDDTGADRWFAEEKYRLLEGSPIDRTVKNGILVNSILAEANGLKVGDELDFETEEGRKASGRIVGIFFSGMERRQDASVLSAYRIENQIFTDHELFKELFGTGGFSSVSIYCSRPERLEELYGEIEGMMGEGMELSASDTLYERLQAPLQQAASVTTVLLVLTLAASSVVVSLILCMWMRNRQKEFAVLISLGSSKIDILLQIFTEAVGLFLVSVFGAVCFTGIFAGGILRRLFGAGELAALAQARVEGEHLWALLLFGGALVLFSSGLSAVPVMKENPRDILSRMEE
ncbi:MAG: ABC transporter permease [Lachnospiraceae bacterium]|nr:ABC transporter permease [Lachnospiraceae bacterium]